MCIIRLVANGGVGRCIQAPWSHQESESFSTAGWMLAPMRQQENASAPQATLGQKVSLSEIPAAAFVFSNYFRVSLLAWEVLCQATLVRLRLALYRLSFEHKDICCGILAQSSDEGFGVVIDSPFPRHRSGNLFDLV